MEEIANFLISKIFDSVIFIDSLLIECCTYDVNLRENKGIKIKKRVASLYICRSADNGFYQGCKKKGSVPIYLGYGFHQCC
jgi:hypothetical protein